MRHFTAPKNILRAQYVKKGNYYVGGHRSRPSVIKEFGVFLFDLVRSWSRLYCPAEAPSEEIREARVRGLGRGLLLVAVVLSVRLISLQSTEHVKWDDLASRQHNTRVAVQGARGTIYDSQGRIMAVSVPAFAVGIHPNKIKDISKTTDKLSQLLSIPPSEISSQLAQDKTFFWLARGVDLETGSRVIEAKLPGVTAFDEFKRHYPQGSLGSPIVGKVGRDGEGLSGIERAFDVKLQAASMQFPVGRDARGRLLPAQMWEENQTGYSLAALTDILPFGAAGGTEPVDESEAFRKQGGEISLSIDSVLQSIVETEFEISAKEAQASKVFGLMMDAESGEILALAQSGRLDPNASGGISSEKLRDVVLQNSFEPGSTLKPIVAAIALDQGVIRAQELINCENGALRVGPHMVRDVHGVGTVTFEEVLIRSSNVGMTKMGIRLGRDRLYNSLREFGFGAQTGVELRGEAKGILRKPAQWKEIDVATHSFGQGVSVTALQMVQSFAVLANGGLLVKPTILKQENRAARVQGRVISEASAKKISEVLNSATEDEHGTGKNSRINGVKVQGKTGTAQKARENGRGYDPDKILASFIGYVDGSEVGVQRKLVFYVAVDEPGVRPRWGGTLAAPVFRRVMEKTLSHLMSQEGPSPVLVKTPIVPSGTGLGPLARVQTIRKGERS